MTLLNDEDVLTALRPHINDPLTYVTRDRNVTYDDTNWIIYDVKVHQRLDGGPCTGR